MKTQTTKQQIEREASELAAMWIMTGTNSGTFGSLEAAHATGSGRNEYSEWRRYTRVGDGQIRYEGCNPGTAPGYARYFTNELSAKQSTLRTLREQIARMK